MIYLYGDYYVQSSYGIRCMYELVYQLNKHGRPAKLVAFRKGPIDEIPEKYREHYIPKNTELKIEHDDIAIYPDSISGNPLQTSRVIRWILNSPLILNKKEIQPLDTDLLCSYSNHVCDFLPQLFYILDERPLFDEIRKNTGVKTGKRVAVYFGKIHLKVIRDNLNMLKSLLGNYEEVNVITRQCPKKREDTLSIIANSDLLISFDGLTNLNYEATLLRTPVLLLDDGYGINNKTFNVDYSGMVFDPENLDEAISSAEQDKAYKSYVKWQNIKTEIISKAFDDIEEKFNKLDSNAEFVKGNIEINNRFLEYDRKRYKESQKCGNMICINYPEELPIEVARVVYKDKGMAKHRTLYLKLLAKNKAIKVLKDLNVYDMVYKLVK